MPFDVDVILKRLEAEYQATVAASNQVEAAPSLADRSGEGSDDDDSAFKEGYVQLGGESEDEEEEESSLSNAQVSSPAADGLDVLPASFILSALPTRASYDASVLLPYAERLELEQAARTRSMTMGMRATGSMAVNANASTDANTDANVRGNTNGASCASSWIGGRSRGVDQDDEWKADFGVAPRQPPPSEPMAPDNIETIRQVMASLPLSPPPPEWAATVPENVWIQQLLRRTP